MYAVVVFAPVRPVRATPKIHRGAGRFHDYEMSPAYARQCFLHTDMLLRAPQHCRVRRCAFFTRDNSRNSFECRRCRVSLSVMVTAGGDVLRRLRAVTDSEPCRCPRLPWRPASTELTGIRRVSSPVRRDPITTDGAFRQSAAACRRRDAGGDQSENDGRADRAAAEPIDDC